MLEPMPDLLCEDGMATCCARVDRSRCEKRFLHSAQPLAAEASSHNFPDGLVGAFGRPKVLRAIVLQDRTAWQWLGTAVRVHAALPGNTGEVPESDHFARAQPGVGVRAMTVDCETLVAEIQSIRCTFAVMKGKLWL
jgi:hypothetical protein